MASDRPVVRVLGPLDVAGRQVRSATQRSMLAWLALNVGRSVRLPAAGRILWSAAPPAVSLRRAQDATRALGLQFPDLVESAAGTVRLRGGATRTDEQAFRAQVAAGLDDREPNPDALRSALELWRGQPYADLPDVAPAERAVAELTQLYLDATEAYFAHAIRDRVDYRVVASLRAAVETHPTRERLWRLLAAALFRASRQAESLAAIDRCRRILGRYGYRVSPAVEQLYVAIVRGDARTVTATV